MSNRTRRQALRLSKQKEKGLGEYAPGQGFTPPASWPQSWWQQGYRLPASGGNAAVAACVSAIAQTMASLPLQHWRKEADGGQTLLEDSKVARILRRPNGYQSRADFVLNLVSQEQLTGNGVALAQRDETGLIEALHLVPAHSATPYVAADASVFYSVSTTTSLAPLPPVGSFFPSRDVLHVRMNTPRHPLIGESPITAAAMAVMGGDAIASHTAAFFKNMTRPSGYLTSPRALKPETAAKLREDWERAYSSENSGKVAVLLDGLEWKALSIDSVDAALIESYKMTIADIARVYRTPLVVIGAEASTQFANSETLIRHWLSTGFGFQLEHVELALDALFGLPPNEFIAFDVEALLRSDFAGRIEGLVKGIQGGLFSPNEGRGKEGLPRVKFGEEPRVQAQVVPLSYAGLVPTMPSQPSTPSAGGKTMTRDDYLEKLRSMSHAT